MFGTTHFIIFRIHTPFKTPNDTGGIVTMVHPNEIKRRLEEQEHETQRTLDAIYTMER